MNTLEDNITLFTPWYSISGNLALYDQRLLDALNDSHESTLYLRNVTIARLTEQSKAVAQHPFAIVPKNHVSVAYELMPQKNSSARRLYSYVKKYPHTISMIVDGIEVRGVMHSTNVLDIQDLQRLVTLNQQIFLPLTQARITICDEPQSTIHQDAILVNRQRIQCIAKIETMDIE